MKILKWVGVAAVVGVVCYVASSREFREDIAARLGMAGRALSGEGEAGVDPGRQTPRIVREQQRKERLRQDMTWTPENRAAHPIEYCQAQLEELAKHTAQLEARVHEVACNQAAVNRQIGDCEAQIVNYEKFLSETKATYKVCEKSNGWPARIGGFALSKEKAKDKIIDVAQKLPTLKAQLGTRKNQLVLLNKKSDFLAQEQKTVAALREKVRATINDLRIKKVVDGDQSIADALNAINDTMSCLGVDYNDPKVEDLVAPDATATRDELFEKIMAE